MRSIIYLDEQMTNAERRFGSADAYIPVIVVRANGQEEVGFLTAPRVQEALDRAESNPEDVLRVMAAIRLRERIAEDGSDRRWLWVSAALIGASAAIMGVLAWRALS